MPIAPRRLDEHVATVSVARLRDRAEPLPGATRVFARDEAQVARELRGALEAPPVDDLRREHHRRMQRDAAKALELAHHRRERRQLGELLDLPI